MRRPTSHPRCAILTVTVLLAALALAPPSHSQEAGPAARGPAKPLARFVPAEWLVFYAEFDGVDAHADVWRKSAAYEILNRTPFGALLEDLVAQGIDAIPSEAGRPELKGTEVAATIRHVFAKGFVFAVNGEAPRDTRLLLAVRDGARPEIRRLLDRLAESMSGPKPPRKVLKKGGRTIVQFGEGDNAGATWEDQGDAVLCAASRVDQILSVLDGRSENASTSRIRAELARDEDDFSPLGLAFLDIAALPAPPPDAAALGLDGVRRIDFRWGVQDDALLSVFRVVAPAPHRGLLALIDQPTFDKTSLPPIPAGLPGFTAASLDPAGSFDRVLALMKATEPRQAEQAEASLAALNRSLGFDVRRDLLGHVGPKLAIYVGKAGAGVAPVPLPIPAGELTVALEINDQAAIGKVLDPLMTLLNARLRAPGPNGKRRAEGEVPQFRKVDGPRPTYKMTLPGPFAAIEPTVTVGKDRLVIAGRPVAAEAALATADREEGRWVPTGAFIPMARRLPSKLVFLNVNDPRETLPALVANLPATVQTLNTIAAQARANRPRGRAAAPDGPPFHVDPALLPASDALAKLLFPGFLAVASNDQGIQVVTRDSFPSLTSPASSGVLVALLLPAVQAAREAARRAQCVNNLKQIGLALHNHHAVYHAFPKAAITDKRGKPLLSWRVALLPYLEQQALYDKFKLDEPWDSPHNRALLGSMPAVFACPSLARRESSETNYRMFVGKGTFLEENVEVTIRDITDGTSNTIAVVESEDAVPWTKPDDLPFDPDKPDERPAGAGSSHAGGFNAIFSDGSVRFLKDSISTAVLRALITRAGGEVIEAGSY